MISRQKFFTAFLAVLLLLFSTGSVESVRAQVKVSVYQELKEVLGREGAENVEIQADIAIEGPIIIRGDKKIDGHGHRLERGKEKGKIYGGSLFLIQEGSCEMRNITISGGGKSKYVVGKVFGRLLEIRKGTLVIGNQCFFCDNINDRLAVDGGGAIRIGAKGNCTMKAGEICNNQTISRGAGILVDRGGHLTIRGGSIQHNRVTGSGAVKELDGRGGAIYSKGSVVISGGSIKGNQAESYREAGVQYGGVGAAVYAETGSFLAICGGEFSDNQSSIDCPIWIRGDITLGGSPELESIYLQRHVIIKTEKSFVPKNTVLVHPAVYKAGICIARGWKTPFALVKKNGYKLERRDKCCYIAKRGKNLAEHPLRKKAVSSKVITPAQQKKRQRPVIHCKKLQFTFYAGEAVDRKVMLYGVRATDPAEGDLTQKLKVIQPVEKSLRTDREGRGEIIYEVKNQQGIRTRKKVYYQIKRNHPPLIRTAPRFLFSSEVAGYTPQQWKQLLLQGCDLTDDCDSVGDLIDSTSVVQSSLEGIKTGKWKIKLIVQDQYGHRFYMKKGEKRRYGKGNKVIVPVSVTLVDPSGLGKTDAGYLRYTEPDKGSKSMEEWVFTSTEIRKIQKYLDGRENPFDRETNQSFLRNFDYCKRYMEAA